MAGRITLADQLGVRPPVPTREDARAARRKAREEEFERRQRANEERLQRGIFRQINECADLNDVKEVLRDMALKLGLS